MSEYRVTYAVLLDDEHTVLEALNSLTFNRGVVNSGSGSITINGGTYSSTGVVVINALTGKNRLAFTSSKPGHTKVLNYYDIDKKFYLVDAPGYGYAKTGIDLDKVFGDMMNDYLEDNDRLRLILFLLDSRRELNIDDSELIDYLLDKGYPFLLVTTKMDKLNQKEKSALNKRLSQTGLNSEQIIQTSSLDKVNINNLAKAIEKIVFDK